MRLIIACLSFTLLVAAAAPALAQSEMTCETILANAERSKTDMYLAATTYFHGKHMGKPCVDVDYVKAFDLAERSGMGVDPFLRILRERADQGHPSAKSALEKLGY